MGRSLLSSASADAAASPATSSNDQELPASDIDLDPLALNKFLFPTHRDLRARLFKLLDEPLFNVDHDLTVRQHRDLTMARIRRVHEAGFFADTISLGSAVGSRKYDAVIDVLAHVDHSIEVKLGVHCGLFGATIRALGTSAQADYWLPRVENFHDFGCFALTELGHGSNVRGIETVARYDPASESFELHTPCEQAQKYWIGGAAESATFAVVFAQLSIKQRHYGIHVFVVRLRDADGSTVPGVQIADCGAKAGLNGVDNGRIWFTRHRVPRSALLSRLSQVAADGTFSSPIPSAEARFGALLGALTGGRVSIAVMATTTAFLGLSIAIRFCRTRRAFAPAPGRPEVPLLFYRSHQRLLMVPLASSLVYYFCARDLRELWYDAIERGVVSKTVHVLSAGYKALFTWFMSDTLQTTREACGGQGYKSENRIAPIRADRDVMLTFEGANGVMLQQISKVLLAELKHAAAHDDGRFPHDGNLAHLNHGPPPAGSAMRLESQFFARAFWLREKARVTALGARYAAAMTRRDGDAFHAWNDCLADAEAAAHAHMVGRIYSAHARHLAAAQAAGRGVADVLRLSGTLWAASTVAKEPDFLRLACITRKEATIVGDHLDGLCERMTGVAPAVIDGIGFPDTILAPIAGDFVEHNSRSKL